jgi:hypothetical protein
VRYKLIKRKAWLGRRSTRPYHVEYVSLLPIIPRTLNGDLHHTQDDAVSARRDLHEALHRYMLEDQGMP